jgi:hypothetical protein
LQISHDNSMAMVAEATAYVYSSKVEMADNIQYMNIICECAGLDEEKKLVLFLNGMVRAPNVHKELRDTASQFRRDQKSWDVICSALLGAYQVLLATGKIAQDSNQSSTSSTSAAEHQANIAELHKKIKSLEKDRAGNKRLRAEAAAANAHLTGPGRGTKAAKSKDDRYCDHCKVGGHTSADCFKLHPCPQCGSTTHGAWNHNRAVAKEAATATPTPGTPTIFFPLFFHFLLLLTLIEKS